MRADYRMQRLFVDQPIAAGQPLEASREQTHYLANVLRLKEGAELLIFNGVDGEWRARIAALSRKALVLDPALRTRPQPVPSDLHYLFAPLKQARLDYMVQKAVEMGAGVLQPVLTRHTQVQKLNMERIAANIREAAEQCGILSLAQARPPEKLDALLAGWDPQRRILFCDEAAETDDPTGALKSVAETRLALLVGPEGGFSQEERTMLGALPFVTPIPLGPRILRADTAAVAALAVIQATIGDWRG